MAVLGQRTTLNINQDSRKIDMVERIKLLQGDPAPLTVLTGELPNAPAINPKFQWQEDDLKVRYDAINNGAGYTSSATALIVDNGSYHTPNETFLVSRTGEQLRVQEVNGNTLTVVRGSNAAALLDDDEIIVIGTAFAEGTLSPDAVTSNQTTLYNYTGILKTAIEITDTQANSGSENSPKDWDHQSNKAGLEHRRDLEYNYWHGVRSESTVNGKPLRTSGGVFQYATENVSSALGTLTEAEFWNALVDVFRHGSDVKFGFASPFVINILNGFARSNIQVVQNDVVSKYGVKIFEYITPFGTLRLVQNKNFEGTVFKGYLTVLDLKAIRKRHMANRDTSIETNIQENDRDGRKDQWKSEVGLEFGEAKKHGHLTGITG